METTGLGTDASYQFRPSNSEGGTTNNTSSLDAEERQYAKDKSKNDLQRYFTQRSSLRKGLRSGEQTSGNRKNDIKTANMSTLADGVIEIMVNRGKDEEYMLDKYGSSEGNIDLINKLKGLEGGKYSGDVEAFINGDGSNRDQLLSQIFPETVSKMNGQQYEKLDTSEKNWTGRFLDNFMGFMPKVAESANDVWNLIKMKTGKTDERSVQFGNYIYEKYGVNIDKVPMEQLDRDYQEFIAKSEGEKKEYTPTVTGAAVKGAEGLVDAIITATPGGAIIKGALSATGATPGLDVINQGIGMAVGGLGRLANYIPGFSNIRDNLQSEKEKEEWDAFVGGAVLAGGAKGIKAARNLKSGDFTKAFETYKKSGIKAAIDEINTKAGGKAIEQLSEKKSDLAQNIAQPEKNVAKSAEQGLDTLNKSTDISKINSIEELSKSIDDEIKAQKSKQMETAKAEDVTISSEQLLDKTPSKVVGGERARVTTPVTSMLDLLIDYYKDVDVRMVDKYKSYKTAIENGTIKLSDLLELKRDANSWGEGLYDKMGNPVDTKLAGKFDALRNGFNKVIDGLEGGEDLRKSDTVLHNLYNLRDAIKTIENEAFKQKGKSTKQSALGKILGRMASGLMFGAGDLIKRFYASFMQQAFKVEPKSMSSLEIAREVPQLLKDFKEASSKLEKAKDIKEATSIFNKFSSKRGLKSREEFKASTKEQAAEAPRGLMYGQYNDEGKEALKSFFGTKVAEEDMYNLDNK